MKVSKFLTAGVNAAVIVAIAAYFMGAVGSRGFQGGNGSAEARVAPLTASEWSSLIQGGALLGNESVQPFVVEFIDYQCKYCASSHNRVKRYLRRHSEAAVLVRHFPLSMHSAADGAARSAICAEEQGLFEEFHTALLEGDDWQSSHDWESIAAALGISDLSDFRNCLESAETRARLDEDRALALEFGVRATPTFISRTKFHEGSLGLRSLGSLKDD